MVGARAELRPARLRRRRGRSACSPRRRPPASARRSSSHNDVNPTNLVYDGEKLLLLDWETAGPNDPFYDLAAIAVFLRMDEGTCLRLLAAYDGEPVAELPARFAYNRRLVAVLCGTAFLHLARHGGHAGATGGRDARRDALAR